MRLAAETTVNSLSGPLTMLMPSQHWGAHFGFGFCLCINCLVLVLGGLAAGARGSCCPHIRKQSLQLGMRAVAILGI